MELRDGLERYVRRRLSGEDAGDVVQATIADALASDGAPADREGFRRFVYVIARNKVADHYRRHSRETADDHVIDHAPGSHDPVSAKDLLRWAEDSLPSSEDKNTLEWMLREADGDKLEHIAEEANVPAPRVRQRVSRLRKYLRAQWAAQLAAAGVAGLVIVFGVLWYQEQRKIEQITAEKEKALEEGRRLRRLALDDCRTQKYQKCVDGLEHARKLDPSGDASDAVREARSAAGKALAPPPPLPQREPAPAPTPPPSSSAPELGLKGLPRLTPTAMPTESNPVPAKNSEPTQQKVAPKPQPKKASKTSDFDFSDAK